MQDSSEMNPLLDPEKLALVQTFYWWDVDHDPEEWRAEITDLTPLAGCSDVYELNLRGTRVRD